MRQQRLTTSAPSFLWLAALVVATPLLLAQDRTADGSGAFVDSVDVDLVNIEVYVTDSRGNRVTSLTRDDFMLEVDGSPVPVSNFYGFDGRQAAPSSGRETPEEQQLHLVVYVDNQNILPVTRNRALRSIRTFLRTVTARVMVVTDGQSLEVRHEFTDAPELVADALFELEELPALGAAKASERRDVLEAVAEADDLSTARERVTPYAESIYNDVSFSIKALSEVVEMLAGLPGRKAILYLSDGIPMRPAEDVFHAIDQHFSSSDGTAAIEAFRYDLSRGFGELANNANGNRVTFHSLDAAGLRTYATVAEDSSGLGGALIDGYHYSNLQGSLHFLADETGGTAIVNTNAFGPGLDRVADGFSSYYSLGFDAGDQESGRYRRIEVRLKDAGGKRYRLRHRAGYRGKPVETRMSESTLAALRFGSQRNPYGVALEIGDQRPSDLTGTFLVPIQVDIPIGKLSFLLQEETYRGRVRLFLGALDADGNSSPIQEIPVPIVIPKAEFEGAKAFPYRYEATLQMRPGRQKVAVGVWDEIGAQASFAAAEVVVGR